ncbi:hypothetical protein ACFLZ9_02170, partial [Patescibacteria group bacterium]
MNKQKANNKKTRKFIALIIGSFVLINVVFGIFIIGKKVNAFAPVTVYETGSLPTTEQSFGDKAKLVWEKALDAAKTALQKAGSNAFQKAISNMLNKMAYDAANYIAAGGKGQSPMAITESMGEYFTNIADEAAGDFIQSLGEEWNINFCEPDFALKVNISFGLAEQFRPKPPACRFTELKKNWDQELDNPNFFPIATEMFDPNSNPWGIALGLQTQMAEDIQSQVVNEQITRLISGLWIDERSIGGQLKGFPDNAKSQLEEALGARYSNIAKFTGEPLIDAANVFINQLAVAMIQELMKNALQGKPKTTQPYDWDSLRFEAGPSAGGIAAAKNKFRDIIKPRFNTRGDYSILAELNMCPDANKAGPTNCVIDDKFSSAIQEKLTVGQAMRQGYLNPDGAFGFVSSGQEPVYNEGYPYRAMIILRKFRIIPIGWEIAAQYIKEEGSSGVQSLEDMVNCFDSDDDYGEPFFTSRWCEGLVDPDWVLKAPKNFCQREGPGPEIVASNVVGEGRDAKQIISRNENYCADEQACINENDDGTCNFYGYCTEEKRMWKFGAEKCDPEYNTCQTFRNSEGKTASYLENTLDFGLCGIGNVGCEVYSNTYPVGGYDVAKDEVDWTDSGGMYFDQDVGDCDEDREGCHEFIRTKPGLGANLLRNSSFEIMDQTLPDAPDDGIADTFDDWLFVGAEARSDSYSGAISVELNGVTVDKTIDLQPPTGNPLSLGGESFALSLYTKDCTGGTILLGSDATLIVGTNATSTPINPSIDGWTRTVTNYIFALGEDSDVAIRINPAGAGCKIDAIKLERGNLATPYSDYRGNGLAYLKLLPDYLIDPAFSLGIEGVCYKDDNPSDGYYELTDNAPAVCFNYTRRCTILELGCNLYTAVKDGFTVSAKINAYDNCPAECVGYDDYYQTATFFATERMNNIIPANTARCNARSVGCEEFTNLDKVGNKNPSEYGAEDREYYTYMRQCVRPADPGCTQFY